MLLVLPFSIEADSMALCVRRTDIVGSDGFAPLHLAAKQNNVGIPTLLEEYGAEIVRVGRDWQVCVRLYR